MKYPKYYIYEKLYRRYFLKGVNYIIKEADLTSDDRVLDICGGNGRLTKELVKFSNNVSYLDQEKDMIPLDLEQLGIKIYNESIENFVDNASEKYTKVFCEQAINYWLLNIDIKKFSGLLEKGGLFIFNTFSNKPSNKPMIKEYNLDNKSYLEISYLIDKKVYHIQVCEGYEPHFTVFGWISREQYIKLLSPYFDIEVKDDGKSSLYICKRR
ncbi:MAG: class I SAM-dependent methyltransferase [Bacilli bacterium]|nr:class I SAM-dependent methyltransferase [Bacilli bacterium]